MSENKRGRGRPRPDETIERDRTLYEHLKTNGPRGRWDLAADFNVNVNIIYLSLHRLRRAGLVQKVRDGKFHLWAVVRP